MLKSILFSIIICLTACQHKHQEYSKVEYRKYKLIGLNQPKHFYVDLKDVETGKTYFHVYVSKHCNSWRNLTIGETYTLKRVYWTEEGKDYADFDSLYEYLCK